jgi:hypothetical protein
VVRRIPEHAEGCLIAVATCVILFSAWLFAILVLR